MLARHFPQLDSFHPLLLGFHQVSVFNPEVIMRERKNKIDGGGATSSVRAAASDSDICRDSEGCSRLGFSTTSRISETMTREEEGRGGEKV